MPVCVPSRLLPPIFWTFLVGLGSLTDIFLLHYIAYADTSGSCSMLPRDKGGVVDPRLKVSKRMDCPAYVCTPTTNSTCRCMERTICASSTFPSSHCTSVLPHRVCLVSSRRTTPFPSIRCSDTPVATSSSIRLCHGRTR